MGEQTRAKTLDCTQSEEFQTKKETPSPERMEIENPSADPPQSDQNSRGFSEIEDARIPETLEECTQGGGEIVDAHRPKPLDKSSDKDVEGAQLPKTVEESQGEIRGANLPELQERSSLDEIDDGIGLEELDSPKYEVNCGEKSDGCSLAGNNSDISCCRRHVDDDDDYWERFRGRRMGPWMDFQHYGYPYHKGLCACGSCNKRGLQFRHNSLNDPISFMEHCRRRGPRFMDWDPDLMYRRGYGCRGYPDCRGRVTEISPFSSQTLNDPEPCPVGAGLANMGNTCFLNAIMQCFTHTVALVQGLHSFKHDSSIHGNDEYCVLCAVRDQIEHSLAYSGRVISPSKLVDNLSHISSFFRRYQQEDAHEFLQCLLDKLDSNWSKYETDVNDSSSSDNSLVKKVFGGRLVSQLHCSKCGHNSYTYEPLIDLSLGIEDVDSLESALSSFTKVESIEDTEKFTCESCKEQVTGEKQLMLDEAPSVAALHLKRFKSDGVYVEKIDKKVEYPLELDLKPYTKGAEDKNELEYELYAVVVHIGLSSTSGHYFCYIRTAPDTWYRFDDSKVSKVSEATALCQDAYILFYARKGTSWFSSLIEDWKASFEQKMLNASPKSVLVDTDRPSTESLGVRHDEVQTMTGVDTQGSAAANRSSSPSSSGRCHDEVKVAEGDLNDEFPELRNVADTRGANGKDETGRNGGGVTCSPSCAQNILDDKAVHGVPAQISDAYTDKEPAEVMYPIPLDHLKIEDKASSAKKPMDKVKHDLKRKEAVKYMSKSAMAGGRRHLLMAAMMGGRGSRSESSWNKKRRKLASFLHARHYPRKRVKISLKRVLRPVTA